MDTNEDPKISALASWFGGNRVAGETVGKVLGRLKWCGVGFMGGAPELRHIDTAAGVANDLHRHVINLARVVADPDRFAEMRRLLEDALFHPDVLFTAQRRCIEREEAMRPSMFGEAREMPEAPDLYWARDYFIACWMGRGGHAGRDWEFSQGLSVRFTSSGGDSVTRFRSAIDSLPAWHEILKRRWNFTTYDIFEFIRRVADEPGHGLYLDPPWPDAGREYTHKFTDAMQRKHRAWVEVFANVRVVMRYGDHPLIRELYSGKWWRWIEQTTTNQEGNEVREVLIVNDGDQTDEPKQPTPAEGSRPAPSGGAKRTRKAARGVPREEEPRLIGG